MFILDRFVHFLMAEVRCFSVCRMSPKILILLAAVWRFLVFLLNLEVFCCFIAKMSEFLDWEHHWFWWNSYLFEYHTTRDIPPCWSSFWRWRPNWRFSQFAAGCLTKQSYYQYSIQKSPNSLIFAQLNMPKLYHFNKLKMRFHFKKLTIFFQFFNPI